MQALQEFLRAVGVERRLAFAAGRVINRFRRLLAASLVLGPFIVAWPAQAQSGVFQKGDAVVSGFAGVMLGSGLPAGANPLDFSFIDLNGTAAEILNVQPAGSPQGQLVSALPALQIKAKDVGQVFAITLDDAPIPNIYLGATSAFGLNIVVPGAGGSHRSRVGATGATWMPGQFGLGGGPGTIYKVDGTTGTVSLFATVGTNSGPGLGDVVFDKVTRQFFVSDLDTGLIWRLSAAGTPVDSYDHGVAALGAIGLAPTPDDGSTLDITKPAFNTEDPATWAFTPKARRINGMAVNNGRLYYAVAEGPQVWSVGVSASGFAADARLEIDSPSFPAQNAVSDITFDDAGRVYLAERGDQKGSYDYSAFVDPHTSPVIRFSPDAANPAGWISTPDTYAVGAAPDYKDATGGIAIGLLVPGGACDLLWSTGDALLAGGQTVNGIQGNALSAVRPANAPPTATYLADYDGQTGDATAFGHVGDVEVWRNCAGTTAAAAAPRAGGVNAGGGGTAGGYPQPYPPGPSGCVGPRCGSGGVIFQKTGDAGGCTLSGTDYECGFTITFANTDKTTPYVGDLSINDKMSAPVDEVSTHSVGADSGWACSLGPDSDAACTIKAVPGTPTIPPNGTRALYILYKIPASHIDAATSCILKNIATGTSSYGSTQSSAADHIPNTSGCNDSSSSTTPTTGISIIKTPGICQTTADANKASGTSGGTSTDYVCSYIVTVVNKDSDNPYNQPLILGETSAAPSQLNPDLTKGDPRWQCPSPGSPTMQCTIPAGTAANPTIPAGGEIALYVNANVSHGDIDGASCKVPNQATLTWTDADGKQQTATSEQVTDDLPAAVTNCVPAPSDTSKPDAKGLTLTKTADQVDCAPAFVCSYTITVTNHDPLNPQTNVKIVDSDTYVHNSGLSVNTGSPSTPGWTCTTGTQDAGCTIGSIPPGGSASLQVAINVNTQFDLSAASCTVTNSAWIDGEQTTTEVDAGAQLPAGTAGCQPASQPTPPVPALAPLLSIAKTGAQTCSTYDTPSGETYACKYDVLVTILQAFTGVLTVGDDQSASGLSGAFVFPDSSPTWSGCSGNNSPILSCPLGSASYSADQTVPMTVTVAVPKSAITPGMTSCDVPNTATAMATDGSGKHLDSQTSNTATDALPPNSDCVLMATPFKTMDNTIKLPGKCPSGFGDTNGNLVNGTCPKLLSTLSATHALPGPTCPAGWDQADHPERLPRTWEKEVVTGANGVSITCARPAFATTPSKIPSTRIVSCPDGTPPHFDGTCPTAPPQFGSLCRAGTVKIGRSCVPACPDGSVMPANGYCGPKIILRKPGLLLCPNGEPRDVNGNCPTQQTVPAPCPFGEFGTPPNCHRILPKDASQKPRLCPDGKTPVPKNGVCPSPPRLHLHDIFNTPPVEQPR